MSDAPLLICKKAPELSRASERPSRSLFLSGLLPFGEVIREGVCFIWHLLDYLETKTFCNDSAELLEGQNLLCESESCFVFTVHYQRGGPSVKCHRTVCYVQNGPIAWLEGGLHPVPTLLYSHVNSMNIT